MPLVFGETFTINSKVLSETRRINVYVPPGYRESAETRLPVLYMPDGGMAEDFLHVAGLVQVSVGNGTMRPFLLVGIENTQRRRDLTGPTENENDKKIAPRVGGSEAFRSFIRDELMPQIKGRYRTTTKGRLWASLSRGCSSSRRFSSNPTCSTPTSLSTRACGGTIKSCWAMPAAVCARARRREKTLYLASSGEATEGTQRLADSPRQGGAPRPALALRKDAGRETFDDLSPRRAESLPGRTQAGGG